MSKLSCIIASLLLLSSSVVWAETTVGDIKPSTPAEKQLLDAAKELEQTAPQAKAQAQEALTQAVNQANQMASQMQTEMSKAQNAALAPNPAKAAPAPESQQAPQQSAPSSTNLEQAVVPNTLPSTPVQPNVAEEELLMADTVKKTHPMADLKLAGGLVALAVLLLAWVFWQPKSKAQKVVAVANNKKSKPPRFTLPQEEGHDEGEYDFLATEEAIPVKLDLARAYIDMDEAESARVVLQSVLAEGDSEQKSEAKALLKELELKL